MVHEAYGPSKCDKRSTEMATATPWTRHSAWESIRGRFETYRWIMPECSLRLRRSNPVLSSSLGKKDSGILPPYGCSHEVCGLFEFRDCASPLCYSMSVTLLSNMSSQLSFSDQETLFGENEAMQFENFDEPFNHKHCSRWHFLAVSCSVWGYVNPKDRVSMVWLTC